MEPKQSDVDKVLAQLEHPRVIAKRLVAERHAKQTEYDFDAVPKANKQVIYNTTVRFSRQRWWSRLLRRA